MNVDKWVKEKSRREFLTTSASGIGTAALASLLQEEGLLASVTDDAQPERRSSQGAGSHMAPKAKACIFIFMAGAPSQIDLFDPKPKLNELHGKPLPESFTKEVRFAFIQKESAVLMGSPRTFRPCGDSGIELSDVLPHLGSCADDIALIRSMHTEAFNHHPGQLMMNTGVPVFGRPSMGSWLNYGLGSESRNLPGYVVLTTGRGTSGGASNWSSGFLPTSYQGVRFRNQGEPVLNLNNPAGLSDRMQRESLEAIVALNRNHLARIHDPEIASRITAYELAYRMQSAAPELIDLSDETQATKDLYGVGREEGEMRNYGGRGQGEFHAFSTNCLLARRLVERGVRFVNLYHATWDHHARLEKGIKFNCKMADQPIAALLKDLKKRGLLDSTLVVWGGEFGRTPLGENRQGRDSNTGRDHHPFAFSVWMAGGGVRGGQVLGKTDEFGWNPIEDPVHINDFHATMLHLFGLEHRGLTYRFQGRDFRLTDVGGKVLSSLVG